MTLIRTILVLVPFVSLLNGCGILALDGLYQLGNEIYSAMSPKCGVNEMESIKDLAIKKTEVFKNNVDLMTEPCIESEKVFVANANTVFTHKRESLNWVQVETSTGEIGWVSKKDLWLRRDHPR